MISLNNTSKYSTVPYRQILKDILSGIKEKDIKSIYGFDFLDFQSPDIERQLKRLTRNQLIEIIWHINNHFNDQQKGNIDSKMSMKQNNVFSDVKNTLKPDLLFNSKTDIEGLDQKTVYIHSIFDLANEKNVNTFEDMELNFTVATVESMYEEFSLDDLKYIYQSLEDGIGFEIDFETNMINPLEVLQKYQNGAITIDDPSKPKQDETWRKHIPQFVKRQISGHSKMGLDAFYETCKNWMNESTGKLHEDLREYICELSEIVYSAPSKEKEETVEDEIVIIDEISESIMRLVEMIILPHQEVLERIDKQGGQIMFSNMWNQPFNDSLKNRVKDRDSWKCVICEDDKDLHIHHKIPRKYGGVNHMNNLVTLCSSCHPAIETADIKKAFKTCLTNFRKNKMSSIKNQKFSENKNLLRHEVEEILDQVLIKLNNKEETELFEDILGVMKRLEIIFYD